MRLSWQAEWVEWKNNASCSPVIFQVKLELRKNILFKRKADILTKIAIFQMHIFQNTFVLPLPSYPEVMPEFFFLSFFLFSFFCQGLNWSERKERKWSASVSGSLEILPASLPVHAGDMQRDGCTAVGKGQVQCPDLSLGVFLFLWCGLG